MAKRKRIDRDDAKDDNTLLLRPENVWCLTCNSTILEFSSDSDLIQEIFHRHFFSCKFLMFVRCNKFVLTDLSFLKLITDYDEFDSILQRICVLNDFDLCSEIINDDSKFT